MKADFDIAAKSYDETFTQSTIGQQQRQRVWNHLQHQIDGVPLRILELNCGTGEDALFLARAGHHVTGTDISNDMIAVCKAKAQQQPVSANLSFLQVDMKTIHAQTFDQSFDLIFSNFGGLNCLSPIELENLFKALPSLLSDQGRMMVVVMPKFCLIESSYFFVKFRFAPMFRRNQSSVLQVNVNGVDVKTYYYSPKHIINMLNKHWTIHKVQSIGFIPSYLENIIKANNIISKLVLFVDKTLYRWNWNSVSDHYLLDVSTNKTVDI